MAKKAGQAKSKAGKAQKPKKPKTGGGKSNAWRAYTGGGGRGVSNEPLPW